MEMYSTFDIVLNSWLCWLFYIFIMFTLNQNDDVPISYIMCIVYLSISEKQILKTLDMY